jgi:hypothetical protein
LVDLLDFVAFVRVADFAAFTGLSGLAAIRDVLALSDFTAFDSCSRSCHQRFCATLGPGEEAVQRPRGTGHHH